MGMNWLQPERAFKLQFVTSDMTQSVNARSITPGQTQRLFALRRFARLAAIPFLVVAWIVAAIRQYSS
jgi:hypothetical protein